MSDIVQVGSTVKIRVFLFNGAVALTGKTVNISIEKLSDNTFWKASWSPGTYDTNAMTEKTGNVHYDGVYEYSFAIPAGDGEEVYEWSVKYIDAAGTIYTKGRIRTIAA